jgi:hypothetical protein
VIVRQQRSPENRETTRRARRADRAPALPDKAASSIWPPHEDYAI